MADELNNQFYYGDKAGVHFPPQNKEDFQELIDYHKKDLSIDQDILAVLNKKVQAQGGEPTEEQEEEIYYATTELSWLRSPLRITRECSTDWPRG